MTADPLVKWQARELSARPGNYYPYRYAGNDPLMMVDVSGHWTFQVGVSGNFNVGALNVQGGFGIAFDSVGNIGPYNVIGMGLGIGAGTGMNCEMIATDAMKIADLKGESNTENIHVGSGVGGGMIFENGIGSASNQAYHGIGLGIGIQFGASAILGKTFTELKVMNESDVKLDSSLENQSDDGNYNE